MNLNTSNPAIKRILSEVKKMVQLLQADLSHNLLAAYSLLPLPMRSSGGGHPRPALTPSSGPIPARVQMADPSPEFEAHPVEDNLFDWHFVLRGPAGTPFEGGLYHGRIILPSQYPHKPPEFMFLSPTGRFEVGKKICLSISQHHPELWQPGWDIRTGPFPPAYFHHRR